MRNTYLNIVLAVCAVVAAGCFFLLGMKLGYSIADAKAARAESKRAAAAEKATADALKKLRAETTRGDALQARLTASENSRSTLAQEKNDALRRLTVGRPCLGGAVVRVLNLPAGAAANAVAEATREPVSADAAAASDTDVALWARQCRDQYDTCRGRLDAIGDFFTEGGGDDR